MCAFIFTQSPSKFVHHPALIANTFHHTTQPKSVSHETKSFSSFSSFSSTGEKTNFFGRFWTDRFYFFLPSWLSAREYLFSVSTTSAYRHFSHRDTLRLQRYARKHTLNTTRKMFSLTQSASFCATKVVAAQKKQQSKIKRSSIQAKAMISSESLSKRDFLSAAVLSFGFLSVGDANAATKRVRKSSSSAAPVKKSPAAKKSAAKPAYKPKGKTVV